MRYNKPHLTFEQQADQLIHRGMIGNRDIIITRLQSVNYYRLSGYWYTFRAIDPTNSSNLLDTFRPGTTFDEIWLRYVFDRQLRLLVMDAIERIEIAVRSQLAYHHAQLYGPFAYVNDPASFPKLTWSQWLDLMGNLRREMERSRETFVKHFKTKYGNSHSCLPVWMVTEIMTFGSMLTFYNGCADAQRKLVATPFAVQDTVFDSWLLAFNTIRNICAHHGRLWNRELGVKPKIPTKPAEWHNPVSVKNDRIFGILTICKWSLDHIAPQSHWSDRLRALITKFSHIPLDRTGFPANWEQCPIWKNPSGNGAASATPSSSPALTSPVTKLVSP